MNFAHDSETPALNRQVITACAFIHHDFDHIPKVFLPKRADTKKFLPGVYELPGGHIDFGEDIITGLKREIREEFGMDALIGDPFSAFTYTNAIKGSHSIEVVYFARFASSLSDIRLDPADHSSFVWIGEDEIATISSENKRGDDPEIETLRKGFALLRGAAPHFG